MPPNLSCLDPQMSAKDGGFQKQGIVQTGASSSSAGPSNYHQENGIGSSSSSQYLLPDVIGLGWDVSETEKKTPQVEIKNWAKVKIGSSEKKKKKKIDRRTARVLDESNSEIRQMIIQQANELLIDEYEDEYDDSFTEFGISSYFNFSLFFGSRNIGN